MPHRVTLAAPCATVLRRGPRRTCRHQGPASSVCCTSIQIGRHLRHSPASEPSRPCLCESLKTAAASEAVRPCALLLLQTVAALEPPWTGPAGGSARWVNRAGSPPPRHFWLTLRPHVKVADHGRNPPCLLPGSKSPSRRYSPLARTQFRVAPPSRCRVTSRTTTSRRIDRVVAPVSHLLASPI